MEKETLALLPDEPSGNAKRLILRKETERRTGLPGSTLREMVRKGKFPKPVKLTARLTAYVESEVDAWVAARISARDRRAAKQPA